MNIVTGKAEVWAHAGEAGMQEKIRMISKHFDIKDISIIFNGKMSYMDDRPRPFIRVPANPTPEGMKGELAKSLKGFREEAKRKWGK